MKTTIPRSVQRQSDAADLLAKERSGEPSPPVEGSVPIGDDPNDPPAPAPAPAARATDDWQQKYRTLKGMYDAEVPRLNAAAREQHREAQELRRELEELRRELNEAKLQTQRSAAIAPTRELRSKFDKVAQEMGDEEFAEVLRGTLDVQDELLAENQRLRARVDEIEGIATETREAHTTSRVERFWNALDEAVPDKHKINNDPAFRAWMGEDDPIFLAATGHTRTRQESIEAALSDLDANRAIRFYQEWTKLSAKKPPARDQSIDPPSGGGDGGGEDSTDGRIYTTAEVKQFFRDAQLGKYAGREEEFKRLDRDIMKAQLEGRIRG